ncbi:MAG TPA: recombinase RecA [Polyangiaceae bacterium]|nr:recombinase RecA [Polyangiaceae bacterium]
MSEPNKSLKRLVADLEKDFGKGAVLLMGATETGHTPVIPTGSLQLDRALGIGGYPQGRIVEIYGPESSGKTTLTLHAIASVQKAGGVAAFIDAEHAFDPRYARAIGVDMDNLLVSQPDCGEQALEIAEALVRSEEVNLVVIDSVAALVPRAELEGDMGDSHMGLHARLMSQALRKLTGASNRCDTTLIFINQLRQKIGVVFGNPETTTGGNALKFYASVRLDVRRIGKVSVGETVVGNRTRVKVVKNKCAQPFTEAEFDIRWGSGIDPLSDLLDAALAVGTVEKTGNHLAFQGENFAHGREKAREALAAQSELHSALVEATRAGLLDNNRPVVPEEEHAA